MLTTSPPNATLGARRGLTGRSLAAALSLVTCQSFLYVSGVGGGERSTADTQTWQVLDKPGACNETDSASGDLRSLHPIWRRSRCHGKAEKAPPPQLSISTRSTPVAHHNACRVASRFVVHLLDGHHTEILIRPSCRRRHRRDTHSNCGAQLHGVPVGLGVVTVVCECVMWSSVGCCAAARGGQSKADMAADKGGSAG